MGTLSDRGARDDNVYLRAGIKSLQWTKVLNWHSLERLLLATRGHPRSTVNVKQPKIKCGTILNRSFGQKLENYLAFY